MAAKKQRVIQLIRLVWFVVQQSKPLGNRSSRCIANLLCILFFTHGVNEYGRKTLRSDGGGNFKQVSRFFAFCPIALSDSS